MATLKHGYVVNIKAKAIMVFKIKHSLIDIQDLYSIQQLHTAAAVMHALKSHFVEQIHL